MKGTRGSVLMQKLMTELEKGRRSGGEQGYFSAEDVEKELGIHD